MFFSYIKSFISKIIIALLGLGLIIILSVGTDIISFGMSDKVVAKINDKDISLDEFNYFRKLKFSQLSKKLLSDKEALKILDKEIVNTIARRKASSEKATSLGLYVSEEELSNKIKETTMFKEKGKFIGFNRYKIRVRDTFGLKVDIFEEILREEILTDKLQAFFHSFVFVSDTEIKQKFIKDSTKLNFYLVKSSNEDYLKPIFNESDIKDFINSIKIKEGNSEPTYKLIRLNYKYLTKDIKITQEDIDSFILNYSDDENEPSDDKIKELLKKRIASNLFPQKIKYFNSLLEKKTFNQIVQDLNLKDLVRNVNFDGLSGIVPNNLINQIKKTDFDNKAKTFFTGDSIWIVMKLSEKIISDVEALDILSSGHLDKYEKDMLYILLNNRDEDDDKIFESIKGDTQYNYEFNYNLSLDEFRRILGIEIPIISQNVGIIS